MSINESTIIEYLATFMKSELKNTITVTDKINIELNDNLNVSVCVKGK